jgi:hypothetical protein
MDLRGSMRVFWPVSFASALRVSCLTQPQRWANRCVLFMHFLVAHRPSEQDLENRTGMCELHLSCRWSHLLSSHLHFPILLLGALILHFPPDAV